MYRARTQWRRQMGRAPGMYKKGPSYRGTKQGSYGRPKASVQRYRPNTYFPRSNLRLGGFMGIELKFIDTVKTFTAVLDSWVGGEMDPAVGGLCCPVKGTGPSDRDGDEIRVKKIDIRGLIRMDKQSDQDDVLNSVKYCICLIQDTQTNGAQLNAEDVMVATDPETSSFRNLQYKKRFKVLKRWEGVLNEISTFTDGANTGSTVGTAQMFGCQVSLNEPVNFVGNAGTIADVGDNSWHLIACTDQAGRLTMSYSSRVRFVG